MVPATDTVHTDAGTMKMMRIGQGLDAGVLMLATDLHDRPAVLVASISLLDHHGLSFTDGR